MNRIAVLLVLTVALVLAAAPGVVRVEQDAVPGLMNLQGYLTDDGGNPVNGPHSIQFRVYRATSLQWQETQVCTVTAGLFSVTLGRVAALPDSIFRPGQERALELVVEGQALEPRVPLTSTGFAFRAGRSDQAAAVDRPLSPAIGTSEIGDGVVTMPKLDQAGAVTGQVIKWTGYGWAPRADSAGGPPTGNAGGDLDGTYPNPEVVGLRGRDIEDTYPTTGDILTYRSSRWELELPAGDVDGEIWDLTVTGLQGRPVYNTSPYTGEVMTWTGSRWEPRELGGDIEDYVYDATVSGLQGRPVSTMSPSTGQVLTWYSSQWTPRSPADGSEYRSNRGSAVLYPVQGIERTVETFGSVSLAGGRARVQFRQDFAGLLGGDAWYVFLQQTSGEPVNTVARKDAGGFDIVAPAGSDASFDWRVVARLAEPAGGE